jgi:Protein of unknown function (DUF3037)
MWPTLSARRLLRSSTESTNMNATKGYYSLVQYCPDVARHEAANVGVVLFCPDLSFLEARIASSNHRVRRFFGEEADQYRHLNAMKQALLDRFRIEAADFRTLENLQQFVETRANKLILSNPKPVKVFNPQEDLAALYQELVEDVKKPLSEQAAIPLRKRLDNALNQERLKPRTQRDVTVEVPAIRRPVKVPYSFQNHRFNLIQPAEFNQQSLARVTNAACKFAVEGRSLFEHPHPQFGDLQLIVVGDFRPGDQEGPQIVHDLFGEYNVRLFTDNSVDNLAEEIAAHGKPVPTS